MIPFVAGISYKTAPVEIREQLALAPQRLLCAGCRLKVMGDLSELVVLSTCNRVEVYGVARRGRTDLRGLFRALWHSETDFLPHAYVEYGQTATEHLFSVASGLESLVLGETEITGQVKQAYQAAQQAKLTGTVTNRLFQTALQAAKEIRTSTGIGRGATSVGSVAVELAERIFEGSFTDKRVMIVGAGKMGEACLRHFAKKGATSVLVANRSYDRALNLANEFAGQAVAFQDLLPALARADIVVTSTGCPETILHRQELAQVMAARRNRPLFLIDIAVPRDVDADVQELANVYLYNVDDLEAIVRENVRHREQELARCREMIAQRARALMRRFAPATPAARAKKASPQPWRLAPVGCQG